MRIVRKLLRNSCILVLLLLLSNCQNDTVTETQQEEVLQKQSSFETTIISKKDMEVNAKLSNKMNSVKTILNDQIGKSIYNEMYDFTIYTDAAKLVESTSSNAHSYTFSIGRDNDASNAIENLVFSYNESNDDYKTGLITYDFTATQKQEYMTNGHVSTPYEISFSPLEIDIDEVLNKSVLPCTVTYQEFHNPQNSSNNHLYSSNGHIVNECQNEGENDEPCDTYTEIIIYCPNGGGAASTTHDTSSPDPSNPNTNNNSNTGGGGNTNDGDTTPNDDDNNVDNVVTSLITREESTKQSILDCINGLADFNTVDNTTIDLNLFEQLNLDIHTWITINNYLDENGCNEDAQVEIIEFLENVLVYPYPHCSSFEYAKPPNINIRACAVTNLTETFYAYGELDGEVGTIAATVNYDLVFFVMPTWMTNGQAATSTAVAVNNALNLTKDWFLINSDASESEIITYLDFMLIEQMALFAGTKTDIPPFTIPSPAPYVTSLLSTGNCN